MDMQNIVSRYGGSITAAQFLETASDIELIRAIRDFGEEKYWQHIIQKIKIRFIISSNRDPL